MDPLVLAPWRNLALIWFILQGIIILVAPAIASFFALKALRWFKRWIRTPLLQAQVWALRIQQSTTKATNAVVSVPVGVITTGVRISATTRYLINFLFGR